LAFAILLGVMAPRIKQVKPPGNSKTVFLAAAFLLTLVMALLVAVSASSGSLFWFGASVAGLGLALQSFGPSVSSG
jgi:hypothetical protein